VGEIPGATDKECGNYLLQDLPMAKWEANKFLTETLLNATEENLRYPDN
jgi:S-ribosylhomocysteine lyase